MTEDGGTSGAAVVLEVDGPVATVTLNRPAVLNALTIPMKEHLLAALGEVGANRAIRAVVLTGAGRAFCAGQDLPWEGPAVGVGGGPRRHSSPPSSRGRPGFSRMPTGMALASDAGPPAGLAGSDPSHTFA